MNDKEKTLAEKREAIIRSYQKKIDQIDAQLADLTAREKLAERKRDTRRKVIMGALAGYHMRKNPNSTLPKSSLHSSMNMLLEIGNVAYSILIPFPKMNRKIGNELNVKKTAKWD